MLIFFISGFHRFLNGFNVLNFIELDDTLLNSKPVITFYLIPIYSLFFCRLIMKDFEIRKELLHFIFPTLLCISNIWYVNFKHYSTVCIFYSIIYFMMLLVKLKTFFYTKKPSILGGTLAIF